MQLNHRTQQAALFQWKYRLFGSTVLFLTLACLLNARDAAAADPPVAEVAVPDVAVPEDAVPEDAVAGSRQAEMNVAGKSVERHAELLSSKNRVRRLRAIHSLNAIGENAAEEIQKALGHDDPAVRYLAATGLARLGGQALKNAKPALIQLTLPGDATENSKDASGGDRMLSVRLAAAYAMCAAGEVNSNLLILIEGVLHPERGIACSACDLIAQLGPVAKAATKTLESVYAKNKAGVKGGDYHVGGAALNALRKIRQE